MRYDLKQFSLPTCSDKAMTDLEYQLRVGNISQAEFDEQVGGDKKIVGYESINCS